MGDMWSNPDPLGVAMFITMILWLVISGVNNLSHMVMKRMK